MKMVQLTLKITVPKEASFNDTLEWIRYRFGMSKHINRYNPLKDVKNDQLINPETLYEIRIKELDEENFETK